MGSAFQSLDYAVFLLCFVIVAVHGYWTYPKKKSGENTATAALVAPLVTFPQGISLKTWMPQMPLLNQRGWVIIRLVIIMGLASLMDLIF